jgi:murein DD-endopeptidase MepM/ murein hydrolase activator NlpD
MTNACLFIAGLQTLVRRKLTLKFVVLLALVCLSPWSALTAFAQDAFAGVWRAGNDPHYLWSGVDWNNFNAKWGELSKQNLRLVDVDTWGEGAQRKYAGVWRSGNDAHYLWAGVDWNNFNAKWQELSKQNLRLTVVRTYVDGGQRKYLGVWRAGNDGHYLWAGVDWNNFNAKWAELSKQGLRLVDVDTYMDGNTRKYIGAWRAGNDGHYLWAGVDWNSFNAKWQELGKQNLRLTVFRTYMDGNQRHYLGVWRAGSDGYYLWAGVDWENFRSKWNELAGQGLRLIRMTSYPGCGSDCANQVIASSPYDYYITGHNTPYRWPVDPDKAGGDHFIRLSALSISAAPFTLPFSDTGVKLFQGWRYNNGNWHHAVDYAIDLNKTFQIRAAAAGKVIFVGWDGWSGNTVVVSHDVGGVPDSFRTVYMHMRNGPSNDCGKAWSVTIPYLDTRPDLSSQETAFKAHLNASGCPQNAASRNPTAANWGTSTQTISVTVGQQVTAGQVLGWAGDTGPGGNGNNNATPNVHLHIFFTHLDSTNGQYYFFDPYGIFAQQKCYPSGITDTIGGVCARYANAWKGGRPQYP